MTATTFIYALCEPTGEVRYVGKADDPEHRLRQHCRERNRNARKRAWIDELRARGQKPVLRILEEVDAATCFVAERRWMNQLRALGAELLNDKVGGLQPGRKPHGFPSEFSVSKVSLTLDQVIVALADEPDGFVRRPPEGSVKEAMRVALCATLQLAGLSVASAARELGTSTDSVRRWLRGQQSPDLEVLIMSDLLSEAFVARLGWERARLYGKAA